MPDANPKPPSTVEVMIILLIFAVFFVALAAALLHPPEWLLRILP
jgi:hypothetical protein